ncbi:MAG: hypothetical protein M3R59_03670 [Verrucomicrobiota bacterium]|nr:hypothetical protein [Verrucomicrobiota bacterium]
MRLALSCALLLTLWHSAAAFNEDDLKRVYLRGVNGDRAAVLECVAQARQLLRARPADALARAYLGSALILRSRDLSFGAEKLEVLREGLRELDAAAAAAAENPRVRLLRAFTQQALPALVGRRTVAREDFRILLELAERDRSQLSDSDLQLTYFHAAEMERAAGGHARARELFRRAARYPADAKVARQIDSALTKSGDAR